MSDYVKIEWSGYFDFPLGNYGEGSKNGLPISGEFDVEDIDLNSSGVSTFSIDEGEPGFPTSPTFSFTLKNRHEANGQQKYPYEYLSTLGRTAEYGGSSDSLAELFIKVYLPNKANKLIFFGMLEDFSYTIRDFEVEVTCSDFIRFIKNTDTKFMKEFDLGSPMILRNQEPRDNFSETYRMTGNLISRKENFRDFYNYENKILILEGSDFGLNLIDVYRTDFPENIKDLDNNNVLDFDDVLDREKSDLIKHFWGDSKILMSVKRLSTKVTSVNTYRALHISEWMTGFVKVGESTLLTRFQLKLTLVYKVTKANGMLNKATGVGIGIRVVHSGNKSLEYDNEEGNTVDVFTRGKYQKSTNDINDIEYKRGDSANISIFDFRRHSFEKDILFDGVYLSDKGSANTDLKASPRLKNEIFIHGSLYKLMDEKEEGKFTTSYNLDGSEKNLSLTSGVKSVLTCTEKGFFNSYMTFVNIINNLFVEKFCYDQNFKVNLIDESSIINNDASYFYISDLMMYKWNDIKIQDVLINYAFQISAYLYTKEDGKIAYQSRDIYNKYIPYNIIPPFSVDISIDDFEFVAGNQYGYGSEAYEIEFSDILEIDNRVSEATEKKLIDKNGESDDIYVSPRKLPLDVYRTSDLGVPSYYESFTDEKDIRTIRPSMASPNLDFPLLTMFPRLPEEQAVIYARSFTYPSVLFSIAYDPTEKISGDNSILDESGLDINAENNDYLLDEYSGLSFPFGIGSTIHFYADNGRTAICLIKGISYSLTDLLSKANWLNIELLLIGYYLEETTFLLDSLNNFIQDENLEFIEQE